MRRTMRGGGGMREASERRATDGSRLPRSESAVRSRARSRRELKSHQRSKYGKPCAVKVARTVWSRGKARALPIATRSAENKKAWCDERKSCRQKRYPFAERFLLR